MKAGILKAPLFQNQYNFHFFNMKYKNEIISITLGVACGLIFGWHFTADMRKPVIKIRPSVTPTMTPLPTKEPQKINIRDSAHNGLIGTASFYSREGCAGCSASLTMANGQPLDDSKLTVAYNRAKLGTLVKVTNVSNGLQVIATVTDTGGFEGLNRIIDLTIATRDAIKCGSLCQVQVEEL